MITAFLSCLYLHHLVFARPTEVFKQGLVKNIRHNVTVLGSWTSTISRTQEWPKAFKHAEVFDGDRWTLVRLPISPIFRWNVFSTTKVSTVNTVQVGPSQIRHGQVGIGQVGIGQVGKDQTDLGQVGPGQVGIGQVGTR